VPKEPQYRSPSLLVILTAVALIGCDSGWKGPFKKPGPVPLSSTNAPITRMVKTRETFEVTLHEMYWDEGKGPVEVRERVKPVVDAIPKELLDRLASTRNVLSPNGSGTRFDQPIYAAWGAMVSVNPDVLIVTVRERAQGSYDYPFRDWSTPYSSSDSPRGEYMRQRVECFNYIVQGCGIPISAGTLVPWSDEMYVVSTDPQVKYKRLEFKNNQAKVILPDGILVLQHHEDDVDVTRE
jgi:hypothetical protein